MTYRPLTEDERQAFLAWRGIDKPCAKCGGSGVRSYSSTATWRGGVGGQACTDDVCDACWGSGDAENHWTNLRGLRDYERDRIAEGALTHLADRTGVALTSLLPTIECLCREIERLGNKRKPPEVDASDWWSRSNWQSVCESLSKALREGIAAKKRRDADVEMLRKTRNAMNEDVGR